MAELPHAAWLLAQLEHGAGSELIFSAPARDRVRVYLTREIEAAADPAPVIAEGMRVAQVLHYQKSSSEAARAIVNALLDAPKTRVLLEGGKLAGAAWTRFAGELLPARAPSFGAAAPEGTVSVASQLRSMPFKTRG